MRPPKNSQSTTKRSSGGLAECPAVIDERPIAELLIGGSIRADEVGLQEAITGWPFPGSRGNCGYSVELEDIYFGRVNADGIPGAGAAAGEEVTAD